MVVSIPRSASRRSSRRRLVRSVRWRKAIRDLGTHPMRTALVILSIAVGVFAVGTIAGSSALLRSNLRDGYADSRPASAALFLAPFDADLVEVVRDMPGIAEAEGRRSVTVVLKTPDGRDREMLLSAIPDFEEQRLDLVDLERGAGRRNGATSPSSAARSDSSRWRPANR
jgi:putative ABC transport system permease protein